MNVVYVEWRDASSSTGWQTPDKDETASICSVGWLVNKTKKTITISNSQSKYGKFLDQLNIPRGWVKKYKILKRYPD